MTFSAWLGLRHSTLDRGNWREHRYPSRRRRQPPSPRRASFPLLRPGVRVPTTPRSCAHRTCEGYGCLGIAVIGTWGGAIHRVLSTADAGVRHKGRRGLASFNEREGAMGKVGTVGLVAGMMLGCEQVPT